MHVTSTSTNASAPTFVIDGQLGQALHYSTEATLTPTGTSSIGTNDYFVTLGVRPDLQFHSDVNFTVAYWIRLPVNYTAGDLPFFTDTIGSTFGFGYVFAPTFGATATASAGTHNGGWAMSLFDVSGNGIGVYGVDGTINDGNWHSLVHVFDRTAGSITYLDGVPAVQNRQAGTTAADAGDVDNGNPAAIGQDPTGGYGETGSADIDDLGVWRKALSPVEAASIYMAGSVGGFSYTAGAPVNLTGQRGPGNTLVLTWPAGIPLESADNVQGPYTRVTGAAPPYTVTPTGAHKFFKLAF
jgi:hypothetical protein